MQSAPGYTHGRFERNTQHSTYHWKQQARKDAVGGGAEKSVQGDQVLLHTPGDSREKFLKVLQLQYTTESSRKQLSSERRTSGS